MHTSAVLEFPQIDRHFAIKCWCPRSFRQTEGRTWRCHERAGVVRDPMYAALNTRNFRDSLFKAYTQYKTDLESKEKYEEILQKELKKIQEREEKGKRRRGAAAGGRARNGH